MTKNIAGDNYKKFLDDLKSRVATSRYKAALSANREMILLYHHIGAEILRSQDKHGWGAKIISTVVTFCFLKVTNIEIILGPPAVRLGVRGPAGIG